MPTIILEYSKASLTDGKVTNLCKSLYETMVEFDCVKPAAMKVRAYPCGIAYYGNGAQSFIHLSVYLLEGRSLERQAAITKALREKIEIDQPHIDTISINAMEMDPQTYQKNK